MDLRLEQIRQGNVSSSKRPLVSKRALHTDVVSLTLTTTRYRSDRGKCLKSLFLESSKTCSSVPRKRKTTTLKHGQLGHGDNEDRWTPKLLPEFDGGPITAASGGWRHMCALAGTTGTLYAWGWNQFGQLGVGSTEDANSPQRVVVGAEAAREKSSADAAAAGAGGGASEGKRVSAVSCGWRHTVAVAGEGGDLYTWGRCTNGQLGHGDTKQRTAPARVQAMDLLRQGVSLRVTGGGGGGGGDVGPAKRLRAEQDLMEVPTGKKSREDVVYGDAAVPDSTGL